MSAIDTAIDFTAHRHPVLAVACPDCKARVGAWCKRPSGHKAMDLHKARAIAADAAWEAGRFPPITQKPDGSFVYDPAEAQSAGRSPAPAAAERSKPDMSDIPRIDGEQYKAAIDKIGSSQRHAALHVFDVDERTSRRWASDDLDIPPAVAIAIALMLKFKVTADQLPAIVDAAAPRFAFDQLAMPRALAIALALMLKFDVTAEQLPAITKKAFRK